MTRDVPPSGSGLSVAIVAYPYISNLDEFAPLAKVPGLSLSWARRAHTIASADLLILPGSKNVPADLAWLRKNPHSPFAEACKCSAVS